MYWFMWSVVVLMFFCFILYHSYYNKKRVLSKEIESMSVEEYNKYLQEKRKNDLQKVCKKLEGILETAHKDYINDCKLNNRYITDTFFISEGEYKITKDDINAFLFAKKVKVGYFKISICEYSAGNFLKIEKI